jgi:hypothetical protein
VLGNARIWADADPNDSIYQTSARQTFHTDSCDIVALLCLKTARSGGLSALVSSTTIFNEMRRRRPDLLASLFRPVATDRRGEVPAGRSRGVSVYNWCEAASPRSTRAAISVGAGSGGAAADARSRGARLFDALAQNPDQLSDDVPAGQTCVGATPCCTTLHVRGLAGRTQAHLLRAWRCPARLPRSAALAG